MLIASPRGFEAPPVLLAWLAGPIDSAESCIPYFALDARDNVQGYMPNCDSIFRSRTSAVA